jgi:hypothetical protein
VELNLIPKAILQRQQLNQKKPYFVAAAISLILSVFAIGFFFDRVAHAKEQEYKEREPKVAQLDQKSQQFKAARAKRDEVQKNVDQYTEWLDTRFAWADLLTSLRNALIETERGRSQPNMRSAVWIERMACDNLQALPEEEQTTESSPRPMMDIRMMMRYGLLPKGFKLVQSEGDGSGATDPNADPNAPPPEDPSASPTPAAAPPNTNEVSSIKLTCRAISWSRISPTADTQLTIDLRDALLRNPMFLSGTNGTRLDGQMRPDDGTNTFRFDVLLKLAKPIKL